MVIILSVSLPQITLAQTTPEQPVCILLKQQDKKILEERLERPLRSYLDKRDEMYDMISRKGLARLDHISKNVETFERYKGEMETDKDEIKAVFIEIEECIRDVKALDKEIPENELDRYYRAKSKIAEFFKLDGYFIMGVEKLFKFMAERRGAYFVKEDRISFIKLNDWEYYRYMRDKIKEIANRQTMIFNSIY